MLNSTKAETLIYYGRGSGLNAGCHSIRVTTHNQGQK